MRQGNSCFWLLLGNWISDPKLDIAPLTIHLTIQKNDKRELSKSTQWQCQHLLQTLLGIIRLVENPHETLTFPRIPKGIAVA